MWDEFSRIQSVLKVKMEEGHLHGVKDTVSLATEKLQEYLQAEGVVVTEGEWKVE